MKYFTPVIHVKDLDTTLKNVDISIGSGAKGVFLINHQISTGKLLLIATEIRRRYPHAWIGINVLGEHPLKSIPKFSEVNPNGWWIDNPHVVEFSQDQFIAKDIQNAITTHLPNALYFGGVAFKYQVQPVVLEEFVKLAARYMDVITTSGDGTGIAADLTKIRKIHSCSCISHNHKFIGIASGITPENVTAYLPYVDWFLVATGVSKDFYNLDPRKVIDLQYLIQYYV